MIPRLSVLAVVPALLLLAGCASSHSPDTSGTPSVVPSQAPSPTFTACPKVTVKPAHWPIAVPGDLPKPPTAIIAKVDTTANNVTIVQFSTATSLREGIIFVVNEMPKAGYLLGRGDAETNEADAPFSKADVRGVLRLLSQGQCSTLWLLAVGHLTPTGGGPVLPNYHATASATPLPFG